MGGGSSTTPASAAIRRCTVSKRSTAGPPRTWASRRARSLHRHRFLQMFEDARGDLWWSATGDYGGLGRWDRRAGRMMRYPEVHGGDVPTAFGEDSSSTLWVGFSYRRSCPLRRVSLSPQMANIPGGAITAIHRDKAGRLWVGSSRDGLTRVEDPGAERPRFVRYGRSDGLSTNNVRCITSDASGRIYVGTVRGVDRIDPRSGLIRRYTTDEEARQCLRDGGPARLQRTTLVRNPRRPVTVNAGRRAPGRGAGHVD